MSNAATVSEDLDQHVDPAVLHAGDTPGGLKHRVRRGGALLALGIAIIAL